MPSSDGSELLTAAGRLADAAAAAGFRGPDPYDGLWFGWPRPVVGGRRRRQVVVQLHARAPLDVRRLYRRSHPLIPKTLSLFSQASIGLAELAGDERFTSHATRALNQLMAGAQRGGWGYPFDVQTRWSFYPAGSPNAVVTSYAVAGLQDGVRRLGEAGYGRRAEAAARWMHSELYEPGGGYWTYHPHSDTLIHNANLLAARAVADVLRGDAGVDDAVRRAVDRTLSAQAADGSWPYGEGAGLEWVDSFHTGYVLICLTALGGVDPAVGDAVSRGARYYQDTFFKPSGAAKLFAGRPFPEDGHSAGTGLTTLAALTSAGHADRDLLARVARYTVERMIAGDHAVFRRYRRYRTTTRYIRWCDGHVALGLVDAARVLSASPAPA
jgi:hypothetical protein